MLCRRWRPVKKPAEACDQIVLLKECRARALHLAHDVPMAGHLGRDRTLARLRRRFWWPGIAKDVAEHCQTCAECQRMARRGPRAPLVPMPIIGEPFERIAMDIVGPLPRTASGKRFILVISDYATRYPEAYAMGTVTAPAIAKKLIDFFSHYGVPKEILTDQGSNFMSELLKEIYQLLGVKSIRTSPYHPQTDGLVERYNQTLKMMLRKVLLTERRSWDKLLPLVLFAYHELARWSLALQPFDFVVEHRKGVDNTNADALSRLPITQGDVPYSQKEGRSVADSQTSRVADYPPTSELPDHLASTSGSPMQGGVHESRTA